MIATALEPILLDVDLSVEEYDLDVSEAEALDVELETAIQVSTITGDIYEGSYDVTPSFEQQSLETRNKTMKDDVTIQPIAVSRTQNLAGGTTIYIGG